MLKSVIIDDEIASIDSLELLLNNSQTEIDVVGRASDIPNAINVIRETKPDLVFLDIEMGGGTGFDVLDGITEIDFNVIFVTAYNQYAIKAFKYAAVDYILKPIDVSALYAAIKRVELAATVNLSQRMAIAKEALLEDLSPRIALASLDTIEIVEIEKIIQFQAEGNYTKVYLLNGKSVLVSRSIKEYEELVALPLFFRCHKSHLINFNHIKRVDKHKNLVVMSDDSIAYISRRKKPEFYAMMESFLKM